MDKFDENNNPVFSKTEDFVLTVLGVIGFGILAFIMLMVCCFIFFNQIFLMVKSFGFVYPFATAIILIIWVVFSVVLAFKQIKARKSK